MKTLKFYNDKKGRTWRIYINKIKQNGKWIYRGARIDNLSHYAEELIKNEKN